MLMLGRIYYEQLNVYGMCAQIYVNNGFYIRTYITVRGIGYR